ncbi:PREDICTED: putative F-box protein At5g55150 [Lupinus angustifolius]|uniref:putative F-box protein At5g55150 n=1 Tax=Lupinus angustifolius TaxID=3871 RepID=UPI00092F97D7|nr:PREDICTED: putative F-box protein At5g55150 [Lupinus angustifolius]
MTQEIVQFDKWIWLPSDLLYEIGKHLQSPKDYVRFSATCKSWNMKLPKTPDHIRGPLLVLPFNHETYDIKEEKDFYLRMPEMQNNILLRGSCFGWLISIRIDGVIQMLNPFTNASYDLPPLSTIPSIVDYHPEFKDQEYTVFFYNYDGSTYNTLLNRSAVQKLRLKKIVTSSSPCENMLAFGIYGEFNRLAWCKFGDTKWTDFSIPGMHKIMLKDAIFDAGKVYALNLDAELYVFDVTTSIGGITKVVPKSKDLCDITTNIHSKYLVRNVESDLLMVLRFFNCHEVNGIDYPEVCYNTEKFEVYKLDKTANKWRNISSLGDYVIVVGFNSSLCTLPFSDGKGNWVRNCIYFSDHQIDSQFNEIVGGHDVGIFNLPYRTCYLNTLIVN